MPARGPRTKKQSFSNKMMSLKAGRVSGPCYRKDYNFEWTFE